MRALLIGAGGVGSAIANIASRKSFITELVIADYDASKTPTLLNGSVGCAMESDKAMSM